MRRLVSPSARVIYWLAGISYVPLLATKPGWIPSDTKQYLYTDPGGLVRTAAYIWSPTESLGTVTHQNIGYLFPMGPYYLAMHVAGVPTWIAERLWTGTILLMAGSGIVYLCRSLRLDAIAQFAAATIYTLTPYVLQYVGEASALLLPWAGLGWMVGLTVKATREGGFRHVAAFGVVVALISSINATSILYVAFAPPLWLACAVIRREATLRRALRVAASLGVVSLLVSAWWAAGLWVEYRYGINLLRFSEPISVVSSTSTAAESLRGLGYWTFYLSDSHGPIVPGSTAYLQWTWLIAISFALPAIGIVSALVIRWRERAYFGLVVLVGMAASVGTHPFTRPSPFGSILKYLMTNTELFMALRSTDRATPLVVLGIAMLAGAGISALAARLPRLGTSFCVVIVLAAVANQPALFDGGFVPADLSRQAIPAYWSQAGAYLGGVAPDTRVLVEPGQNTGDYTWGYTYDPLLPGLTTRPVAERFQIPYGTIPSVDLLETFDNTFQDQLADPNAFAAIARLISAGDVLVQSDLQHEQYLQPPRQVIWGLFSPTPAGLTGPTTFGPHTPDRGAGGLLRWSEQTIAIPLAQSRPSPVAVFGVPDARPIVRAESVDSPVVIDGDGDGIVAAAGTGLLDGNPTILYAGSYTGTPGALARSVPAGAVLVLTDSNRLESQRWMTVPISTGYTDRAGEVPSDLDGSNTQLTMFPLAGSNAETVAEQRGVASVTASSYGDPPFSYAPENRPGNAFDGNPGTFWLTAGLGDPVGQWLRIDLGSRVTTGSVTLDQAPKDFLPDRWITQVRLTFDGRDAVAVNLGDASRTNVGQVVTFPTRTFRVLTVTITKVKGTSPRALGGVGFTEVGIRGRHMTEFIRPPVDMLQALGRASIAHRLVVILSRERVSPYSMRLDPEINLQRDVELPTARTFTLVGSVHLSPALPDELVDVMTGRNAPGDAGGAGVIARSQGRLPGNLSVVASSAADGDPSTLWEPGLGLTAQLGTWIEMDTPAPVTFDHLSLQVVADGRHSVPARITISTEQGERTVDLPAIHDSRSGSGDVSVPIHFAALSGRRIRVTIQSIRPEYTVNVSDNGQVVLPVAIADLGIPGVAVSPLPAEVPSACRNDLVAVDGRAIWVRISGSTATALAGGELPLTLCGPDARGVPLHGGHNDLTTVAGSTTGIYVDQLVLDSAAGGTAEPALAGARIPAAPTPPAPATLHVNAQSPTSIQLTVRTHGAPFWLVLGESQDRGWAARIDGGADLGSSALIDGYANGWLVDPGPGARTLHVTISFTPQRLVWAGLGVSTAALALCIVVVALPRRRGTRASRAGRGVAIARAGGLAAPVLAAPWRPAGRRAPLAAAIPAAALAGAAASLLVAPLYGVPVALAALLAMEVGRMHWLVTFGGAALAVGVVVVATLGQVLAHHPSGPGWPSGLAGTLAWLCAIAVLTDVLVVGARLIGGGGDAD